MEFLSFVPRLRAFVPRQYSALRQASDFLDNGSYRSAVEILKEQALVKGDGEFIKPFVEGFKIWFGFDKKAAFEELSASVHCAGGNLRDQLAETFKELACRWHKVLPSEAVKAVEDTKWLAQRDSASLYAKAWDQNPTLGRPSSGDISKIAEQSFIYQLARETLVIMRSSERPKTGHAMSVDDFRQRHGYGN